MNEEQPGLTVQEAAGQLGIVERRLRRILARPEYADRTVTVTRQTKSGIRTATVLPSDLLSELQAYLHSQPSGNNADTPDGDSDAAQRRQFRQPTRQASGELTASEKNNLLVQIVSKQDAEILFLRRQVEELTATVRVLSEKSAVSLSETAVQNASQDVQEAPIAQVVPNEAVEPIHPWWRRLWRKQ